jgi:hypothetical protein
MRIHTGPPDEAATVLSLCKKLTELLQADSAMIAAQRCAKGHTSKTLCRQALLNLLLEGHATL